MSKQRASGLFNGRGRKPDSTLKKAARSSSESQSQQAVESQLNFAENHAPACKMAVRTQGKLTQTSVGTPAVYLRGTLGDTRVTHKHIFQTMTMINLKSGSLKNQDGPETATHGTNSKAVHGNRKWPTHGDTKTTRQPSSLTVPPRGVKGAMEASGPRRQLNPRLITAGGVNHEWTQCSTPPDNGTNMMNGCKPGKITGAKIAEETPGGLTCGINNRTRPGLQEPRQTKKCKPIDILRQFSRTEKPSVPAATH